MTAPADLAAHFDAHYLADPDPWGYRTRWVELRRHALMLSALGQQRYRRAFEPACGPGVFTASLAQRCDELVAWDASPVAVELAVAAMQAEPPQQQRCALSVEQGVVPDDWPTGHFDLIVVADFAYYLDRLRLRGVADRVLASTYEGADVLVAHWTGSAHDFEADARELHDILDQSPLLDRRCVVTDDSVMIGLYRRRS